MKLIIIALTVLFSLPAFGGEINTVVEDTSTHYGYSVRGGERPFTSKIEFLSLPAPLKETRLRFTLEVINDDLPYMDKDWMIKIGHNFKITEVSGDEEFAWPGPHKSGNKLVEEISFIPLVSGPGSINIFLYKANNEPSYGGLESGSTVSWCLNEDGELLFLGSPKLSEFQCSNVMVNYFDTAPIIFQYDGNPKGRDLFSCMLNINPLPKINDTIVLNYKLVALKTMPDGCDLKLNAFCMDIVSFPPWNETNILKGQEFDLSFILKPNAVADKHTVVLRIIENYNTMNRMEYTQNIPCHFLYESNGDLKYISQFSLTNVPQDKYSKNFRKADQKRDRSIITLKANGEIHNSNRYRP